MKYVNYDIVFQEVPDEVTLAFNISNCPNRCPGCHSSYLMDDVGAVLSSDELERVLGPYAGLVTCVCFMGGDASPDEVSRLAEYLNKSHGGKYAVAWYSGRSKLPDGFNLSLFKYIKLGPFVSQLGNLRSVTTNQRLYRIGEDGIMKDITARFWKQ